MGCEKSEDAARRQNYFETRLRVLYARLRRSHLIQNSTNSKAFRKLFSAAWKRVEILDPQQKAEAQTDSNTHCTQGSRTVNGAAMRAIDKMQNNEKENNSMSAETKAAYSEKVQAELDKMNARIDELKAKANQAKADASVEYQTQIEELSSKRDAAKAKLEEIQQTSEDAWEDVKGGFEGAWNELVSAFDSASKKFQ